MTLVLIGFLWWNYQAGPTTTALEARQAENDRISRDIENTRVAIAGIRQWIASGVHREKQAQLAALIEELAAVEEQLRVTTIELVDPEKMFQLMNQLVYRESKLTLLT